MPMISVGAKCVICGRDLARDIWKEDLGRYSAELSELIFCEECKKKLKDLLYKGDRQ